MVNEIDYGATYTDLLKALRKGGGTGSGFKELTTQYVRAWDLEAGIYKWTYNGQKYLYYNGATATENVGVGNAFNLDVYLEITSIPATKIIPEMKSFVAGANIYTARSQSRYLVYGMTSAESGSFQIRDYANFPSSTPVTLLGEQSISGNKTFNGNVFFNKNVDFSNATVIGLPSNGGSSGDGIPVLTTQTVNLADLEAGIYKWDYSDENGGTTKHFYYSNEGDVHDFYSNPVFIQVRQSGSARFYYILDDNGMGIDENSCHIYYGGMDVEVGDGYLYTRDLSLIPEEYIDYTQYIKKTKITVAELKSYLANYSLYFGKMVQLVYKGTTATHMTICNDIGILTILNSNSLVKNGGNTDANESSLSGMKYNLRIDASSASFSYYYWDFDFAVTNIGAMQTIQITDSEFDIYIIG